MFNIPNSITFSRILLIPVLVVVYIYDYRWSNVASAAIFAFAALTDWVDGYLARKLEQMSPFGAFLDPVADKLMVATALILLVFSQGENLFIVISSIVIIGREITISALREWMAEIGKRGSVAVSYLGKVKTFAQMSAIALLLYENDFMTLPIFDIGLVLLVAAAILTIISMLIYLKAAWSVLKNH